MPATCFLYSGEWVIYLNVDSDELKHVINLLCCYYNYKRITEEDTVGMATPATVWHKLTTSKFQSIHVSLTLDLSQN